MPTYFRMLDDPKYRACVAPQSEHHNPNFGASMYAEGGNDGDDNGPPEMPPVKAQDFHIIVAAIMASYGLVEDSAIEWDEVYKGKTHRLLLLPFIFVLKVDGLEANKFTGQYLTKTGNVSSLCGSCVCPTISSDQPYRTYQRKTQSMIQKLVASGDLNGLKRLPTSR